MGKQRVKLNDLERILASFGVSVDRSCGKGSHLKFFKQFPEGRFSYPVPNEKDVLPCYVKGCRKRFRLTKADGVTDEDFFAR